MRDKDQDGRSRLDAAPYRLSGSPHDFAKSWTLRRSMGGYGSGRSGGRPTTDNGLTLTLSKLFRDGLFRPGSAWGSLVWTNTTTGEQIGSISYEANLGQELRTCSAKVHDHPMGRGAPRVRLLDPARDNAPTLRRPAVVVHMPADGETGGEALPAQRRIHLRVAPSVPARLSFAA